MKIEQRSIKVKEIFEGYIDKDDDGVFAYSNRLSIRPPYQRSFVYDVNQAEAVIHTVLKNFPLNVMYWVKTGDDTYEVLDGQQRTLSIMHFLTHKFRITLNNQKLYWDSLPDDLYNAILEYELMIYVCEGEDSEKLAWFEIVNVAGEKLTHQELLNASYTGPWLSDAKKHFSKRVCAAQGLADKYIKGDPNRQELLEKALAGIAEFKGLDGISDYMALHKSDEDADELWQYFQDVIHWIEKIFPTYYPDMKGLDWCSMYNKYHTNPYNSKYMDEKVKDLHIDEDVQKPTGIYLYLLTKDDDPFAAKHLHLRAFDKRDKIAAYSKQQGICPICQKHFEYNDMEGDHIVPWSKGGHTTPDNCQMLCRDCNSKKSDMY